MRTASLLFVAMMTAALVASPGSSAAATDEATLKLFKSKCVTCHGVDGMGQTKAGQKLKVKDWTDGKTLEALTREQITKTILEGVKGEDGKKVMSGLSKPTDETVTALVNYVMTFMKKK